MGCLALLSQLPEKHFDLGFIWLSRVQYTPGGESVLASVQPELLLFLDCSSSPTQGNPPTLLHPSMAQSMLYSRGHPNQLPVSFHRQDGRHSFFVNSLEVCVCFVPLPPSPECLLRMNIKPLLSATC